MDSTISKTTQSLTSAEDMRNQTKLIMQPHANWEEYLTPAPLSIAILGELVFISSTTDFSINKNPPNDGYKYIKYPESFRACLMQVCNSGWWAFNEAHNSMDQIRLHTAQVPDYMKTAVKILFQDNDEVIQAHLPDQLNNIRIIADECLKLSATTEERFMDVIKIIQELLEACVNAEHFYGEEMEAIKKKIQENELRQQSAEETKKRTEKAVSALENELEQAHESYQNAMDSLPGGWQMMTMDLVSGLTQSLTGLINGVTSIITYPVRKEKISNTISQIRGEEVVRDVLDEINSYSKSTEILIWVQRIQELMNVRDKGDYIDWTKLYDQKSKTTPTDFVAEQLNRINDDLGENSDGKVKSEAQKLCLEGINICTQLAIYAPEGKCDKDTNIKIIEKVLKLVNSARVFDSKSKDITKSPAISSEPPMMFENENRPENMSLLQQTTENARFAIEQSRAQLNKTREDYDKCVENQEKTLKELTEILVTKSPAISSKPPMMLKNENRPENMSLSQQSTENARFALDQSRAQLNKTREDYDKCGENLEKNLKELTEIMVTKSPAISSKPPMMLKKKNRGLTKTSTENARFAIEQSRVQLNKTRDTYEKCMENLEKNQKELTEILVTMRNCDLKEIDFKTTIEMLIKGMDAMGKVKEQWEKMVHFFQMVSNIVKTSLSKTLTNFVSTSEKTQALSYNAKLFSKDLLYTQAFQACNIVSLVHMISDTYTDVSSKYLMDRVSSLGKLMAMDKSKPEFELERHMLQESCDAAQKGILSLVLKNKDEFERKCIARQQQIDRELLAILPAAPPEETKRIQEAVQAGFSEEEAESYY